MSLGSDTIQSSDALVGASTIIEDSPTLAPAPPRNTQRAQPQRDAAGRSLRTNIVWTAAGNATYAFCQWATLVALAKVSSLEFVGEFALAVAIVGPVFTFANLQLRAVQATDALRQYTFGHYLGLRLISTPIALVVIAGILSWAGYPLLTACVVLVVGVGKAIESVSDVVYGELQSRERLDWIACSMIFRGLLSLIAIAGTVAMTGSLLAGLVAMCGVWAANLILYDLPKGVRVLSNRTHGSAAGSRQTSSSAWTTLMPIFEAEPLARVFFIALPLGSAMLLSSLNVNIPRYFIEQESGHAALGVYASISAIFSGLYFFQIALGHAVLPRLARCFAEGNRRAYLRLAGVVLGFGTLNGLAALLLAIFGGGAFLQIVFSAEFAHADRLFVWLAIASIAQCVNGALAYFLHAARQFKQTAWASAVSTVIIFGASAVFIPRWGAVGGAYAVLVGTLVSGAVLAVQFLLLLRTFKEDRYAI